MPALIDTIRDSMQQMHSHSVSLKNVRLSTDAFEALKRGCELEMVNNPNEDVPPAIYGVRLIIEKTWEGIRVEYE